MKWIQRGQTGVDYMKCERNKFLIAIPVPAGEHRFDVRSIKTIDFYTKIDGEMLAKRLMDITHYDTYITKLEAINSTYVEQLNDSTHRAQFTNSDICWVVGASTTDGHHDLIAYRQGHATETITGEVNEVDITINVIQPGVLIFLTEGAWIPSRNYTTLNEVEGYEYNALIYVRTLQIDLDGISHDLDLFPSEGMRTVDALEKYYEFKNENMNLIYDIYQFLQYNNFTFKDIDYCSPIEY